MFNMRPQGNLLLCNCEGNRNTAFVTLADETNFIGHRKDESFFKFAIVAAQNSPSVCFVCLPFCVLINQAGTVKTCRLP